MVQIQTTQCSIIFRLKKTNKEIMYEGIYDTKTFTNYNNLTAAIVTGYSLSVAALNNDDALFHIGGSMAASMRNVLRDKMNYNIKNECEII